MDKTCVNCNWCKEVIKENDNKLYYCQYFEVKICNELVDKQNDCDEWKEIEK